MAAARQGDRLTELLAGRRAGAVDGGSARRLVVVGGAGTGDGGFCDHAGVELYKQNVGGGDIDAEPRRARLTPPRAPARRKNLALPGLSAASPYEPRRADSVDGAWSARLCGRALDRRRRRRGGTLHQRVGKDQRFDCDGLENKLLWP